LETNKKFKEPDPRHIVFVVKIKKNGKTIFFKNLFFEDQEKIGRLTYVSIFLLWSSFD